MTTTDRTREQRLRRMAKRQGFELRRSRRRDPYANDYGVYWLIDPKTSNPQGATLADLDAVERYLKRRGS